MLGGEEMHSVDRFPSRQSIFKRTHLVSLSSRHNLPRRQIGQARYPRSQLDTGLRLTRRVNNRTTAETQSYDWKSTLIGTTITRPSNLTTHSNRLQSDVLIGVKKRLYSYNTGMDKTSLVHQLWEFICEGLCLGVHVTSNVITYHCSACRRRGTIERRLTLLRNTWLDCYLNIVVPLEYL